MSWNGDFIGLPDLIVRSCAFTSVIISLELHLMVVSLFEAHTVHFRFRVSFVDL